MSAVGCSKPSAEEESSAAKVQQWAKDASKGIDAIKTKEESLRHDKKAIVARAAKAMKDAAAENFGSAAAAAATISADESGIKDFGERKWEVAGTYDGQDEKGKRIHAPWTATIELAFGNLQCMRIRLGQRTP